MTVRGPSTDGWAEFPRDRESTNRSRREILHMPGKAFR